MLNRKSISILLSVFVLAVVGLSLISQPVAASGVFAWKSTTSYPTNIHGQSCVQYDGYIYCVGGNTASSSVTDAVYFASASGAGVGAWASTTSYPTTIDAQSCVATTDGYVYCVGGYTTDSTRTDTVYFASLHTTGVSVWTSTTSYPLSAASLSCVVNGGYIYCVGGDTSTGLTASVYYAPISGTGVGAWTATTSYPTNINAQSCVTFWGQIICVGGYNGADISSVYYAPSSSSGVGAWTATTSYPTNIEFQNCVVVFSAIYCVAGSTDATSGATTSAVYYGTLSHTGAVLSWTSTKSYPISTAQSSCAVGRHIYCVGGTPNINTFTPTNAAYYAST